MKKIKLLVLLSLMTVCNSINAQIVIFNPATDNYVPEEGVKPSANKPQSITKDNVTINLDCPEGSSVGCGMLYLEQASKPYYRIYKYAYLTISSSVGKILRIELNSYDKNTLENLKIYNGGGSISTKNYKQTLIWTGESDKVVLQNKGNYVWISRIKVTLSTLSISKSGYATVCFDVDTKLPEGIIGHTISSVDGNKIVYGLTFNGGDDISKNIPIIVEGEPGMYSCDLGTNQESQYNESNLLRGSDGNTVRSTNSLLYKLSYDRTGTNVGFYWDSEDGKSLTIPAGRAYLKIENNNEGVYSAKGFSLDDAVDGIKEINTEVSKGNGKIYNLNGQFVGNSSEGLAQGIYIINGKKIVIR